MLLVWYVKDCTPTTRRRRENNEIEKMDTKLRRESIEDAKVNNE